MFNLIEVQTALQSPSVQLADLMKYANGSSAEVPAYLALGELNRRKQLEATNTAFNAKPPTVKDQLTNAPPAVNPTVAPTGIAPTATPPQLAATTAAPPRMNVAAAPVNQVNPIAPPQLAAEGGLMSIPTPHMFKQESYANGGIVAFAEGDYVEPNAYQKEMQDKTEKLKLSPEQEARKDELDAIKYLDEAKVAKDKKEMETWKRGVAQTTDEVNALRAQRQAGEENPAAAQIMANGLKSLPTDQSEFTELGGIASEGKTVPDTRRVLSSKGHPATVNTNQAQFDKSVKELTANAEREKTRLHAANANQDSTKVVGGDTINAEVQANLDKQINMLKQSLGIKPVAGATQDVYKNEIVKTPYVPTLHQAPEGIPTALPVAPAPVLPPVTVERDARQDYKAPTAVETQNANMAQIDMEKALREKAGISEDPHQATRERMDKLEAKRAGQEAQDPFNSLMARLAAFGSSKEQTFGGGMGESAIAGAKLSKETAALRDKQATEIIAARQAMETAEDARKRGDLTTVKAATKEVQKNLQKASELESASRTSKANETTAETGRMSTANTIAWTPFHEATLRMEADAKEYAAHNPHASAESIKANSLASIKREFKNDKVANPTGRAMTEIEALSAYNNATNSSRTDISDARNLHQERQKAETDFGNPLVQATARKMFGKDLTRPQLKAKFMDDRLSSLPGYTPSSGTTTTNAARAVLNK